MTSRETYTNERSEILPSAGRLIRSLRDLGYDLPAAVADLVDNSIAAFATVVRIDMTFAGEASWIRIADNGGGMTPSELREAMRFGTRRDYEEEELGKFGLGLKAASLSQCRRLTLGTRSTLKGPLRLARWDLDHIEWTDRWEVLHPKARDCALVSSPLRDATGTVVLWEQLDRVLRYRLPDGKRALADFHTIADELKAHLGMVFHRFLSGEARRELPLRIIVNDESITPWDPFARNEPKTQQLPPQRLRLKHAGRIHWVAVRPFVLPTEAAFSTQAAHQRAAGLGRWNRQQGFYFYRSDRLIQCGGWSRLRTVDEHTKLARVSIDIPTSADEAFQLSVSKTQVRIPPTIRPELSAIASSVTKRAQETYRGTVGLAPTDDGSGVGARIRAIRSIVRMVLQAVEHAAKEELDQADELRDKFLARLQAMETSFCLELSENITTEVQPNGHADRHHTSGDPASRGRSTMATSSRQAVSQCSDQRMAISTDGGAGPNGPVCELP